MAMTAWLETDLDLSDPGTVSAIDALPLWSAPFGLELLEVIRVRESMRVLDVGCGTGFPAIEIAERLGAGSEVCAVDPWAAALERARAKACRWGVTNLRLVEGQAEALPFEDRSFDLIVSNNGTNNIEDEERVFAELRRVARPGAQLVLTMNLPGTMQEFYDAFDRVLSARGMAAERERVAAHIFRKRKPLPHVLALLARHGFEIVGTHEDTFRLRFADGTAMLQHSLIRLGFLGSWIAVLDGRDVFPVFEQVEAELNRLSAEEGELSLTVPWVCLDCRRST